MKLDRQLPKKLWLIVIAKKISLSVSLAPPKGKLHWQVFFLLFLSCVSLYSAEKLHPSELLTDKPSQATGLIARHLLVLYGWDAELAEKPRTWPVDTMTGELLQAPLEWLGYEVFYHNIGESALPEKLDGEVAGIIIDGELEIPAEHEMAVAEWLIKAKEQGKLLLFVGAFPFSQDSVIYRLQEELGLKGDAAVLPRVQNVKRIGEGEMSLAGETPLIPRAAQFTNIQAPESATVLISLSGDREDGQPGQFDPVFLDSWGGMWLEPYVILRASADNALFYVDPYSFLANWLKPLGVFPVPDPSTLDGRRIFYSHIDGDGFASLAELKNHPTCAEVVRDRILKKYPLPVTVSIIEADIRALAVGLNDKDIPLFRSVAQEIFALPNVQAASHSHSHPYIWEPRDPNPGTYDEPCLPLKKPAAVPGVNLDLEVRSSVEFINNELLPEGQKCELFLWSGNCRPGPDAIRAVREMGLVNLNGGNTIISRLYPGLAGVAPRVMWWDDELQVHASNQNEFMYANGFNGPFYGGFADVIDTFERTETPRRLKPVNVYYHFYSATYLSSLRALEKIYNWSMEQKLHAITARQFVDMTKDSLQTRISRLAANRWLVENQGLQRTFRIPVSAGVPDVASSKGVLGYVKHGDQYFIHTNGQKKVEIAIAGAGQAPVRQAYLQESSATLKWKHFEALRLEFSAEDYRPIEVVIAGLTPSADCQVMINGRSTPSKTDAQGILTLSLPQKSHVLINPPRHAPPN